MTNVHNNEQETSQHRVDERHESMPALTGGTTQNEPEAIDATEGPATPLPRFQLFLVLLIQFAEPITALVIYPFINQFVRDTGITGGDDRKTGYYAGVIESAFFFAEAATVFHWGWLSDRIGRRPILLLGPFGLTFAMLKFGLSTSFWPMVWTRCFQGLFNGNIGVSKTVMIELTDETNIGDAVAMIPLMWSVGSTLAPIIGGVLSNPATRWPQIFGKIALFKNHPYFLPCLVSAVIAFFAFVISFIGLKETLSSIVARETPENVKRLERGSEISEATSTDTLLGHNNSTDYGTTTDSTSCPSPTPSGSSVGSCERFGSDPPTLRSTLKSRHMQFVIINYLFLTFTDMCYNVLMPLVYSTPIHLGGLGLNPYQIGLTMGIWGLINAFIQINFLGGWIKKYGANRLYRYSYSAFFVTFLTFPFATYLARRNGGIGVGTCILILVQLSFRFLLYMGYGAMHVVVAEITPKPVLGSINGLVQMVGCLMRTMAPTFASSLFSLSLEKHLLGGNFTYVVILAIVAVGIKCSWGLPQRKRRVALH